MHVYTTIPKCTPEEKWEKMQTNRQSRDIMNFKIQLYTKKAKSVSSTNIPTPSWPSKEQPMQYVELLNNLCKLMQNVPVPCQFLINRSSSCSRGSTSAHRIIYVQ